MHEQLIFTQLMNRIFGGVAASLMKALGATSIDRIPAGAHPLFTYDPAAPINNFVAMQMLVFGILILFFLLVRARLSVESPGGLQHVIEGTEGFVNHQSEEIIGHQSEHFTPFLVTLGLFILVGNLLGLVPGFDSPTASPSVPLGCAIVAWLYYHYHGIRKQGPLKYAAHFVGPMPVLAVLMVPIEIISHLARMMSLTIRLYANMYAGDLVTMVFFSLVPIGIPVLFLFLHIGVSFLQAYIFVLLATVYLAGAVAEEH